MRGKVLVEDACDAAERHEYLLLQGLVSGIDRTLQHLADGVEQLLRILHYQLLVRRMLTRTIIGTVLVYKSSDKACQASRRMSLDFQVLLFSHHLKEGRDQLLMVL